MDFSYIIASNFFIICFTINIAQAISISHDIDLYKRQTTCPDGSKGYTKLGNINLDQQEEYERIRRGQSKVRSQYEFFLCEGTIFDASFEPLEVHLDGVLFSCGGSNDSFFESMNECVISGGTEQVLFAQQNLEEGTKIEFRGITFESFTKFSVESKEAKSLKATFRDCHWRDFDAYSIIHMGSQKIEIYDSTISNGIGQSLFVNNGGELYLENLMFISIDASAIMKTSSMGESIIADSTVTSSYVNQIMLAMEGRASQTIKDTKVFDMTFLGNIFKVKDSSSSSLILSSRGMLDQAIERGWRDEHTTADNTLTAKIKFNHLHQTTSAEKMKSKVISNGPSCAPHAIAAGFDASIKIKNPQMKDRKLTEQIFDSAHDGSLLISYLLLDII